MADAVFLDPAHRQTIERAAGDAGAPFVGLWLDAPETCLVDRVSRRRGDASDADLSVVRRQLGQSTGEIRWPRLDTNRVADAVAREASTAFDISHPEAVRRPLDERWGIFSDDGKISRPLVFRPSLRAAQPGATPGTRLALYARATAVASR